MEMRELVRSCYIEVTGVSLTERAQFQAEIEKLVASLEARGISYLRVLLDVEEIEQFCEEQGIPNDAKARSILAIRKAEQNTQ